MSDGIILLPFAEQGPTRRQIAIRLLPFLFLLYIVNFLDRASVAYAAIGMSHDLGFNDRVFGLAFGIFFAGYVILQIPCAILVERWSGMSGWRWLFVVEGLPAVVLGIVAYFFLTDSPGEAQWLKPEQRDWIARTLEKQKPQGESSATVWDAFRSRRALLLAGIAFLNYSIFSTFIFWLPTWLRRQSGLA